MGAAYLAVAAIGCGPSAGGAADAADTGGGTGAPTCEDFQPLAGVMIALSVTNNTANPIFLPRKGCRDPIGLLAAQGEPPVQVGLPDCEAPSCDNLLSGDCGVDCAGACVQATVRVAAGATYVRTWNGSVWHSATVPDTCVEPSAGCTGGMCFQQSPSAPATYTMDVEFSGCPNEDPATCECPNGEDVCEIAVDVDAPSAMPAFMALDFEYPADTVPTIVIE